MWHRLTGATVRINLIAAMIGLSSGLGYGVFVLLMKRLSKAANTAFRAGFFITGVTSAAMLLLTGWSLPYQSASPLGPVAPC